MKARRRQPTRRTIRWALGLPSALAFCLSAPAETGDAAEFASVVTTHFAVWDRNHDGVLSTNELDVLVADPQIIHRAAAAVAALKRASRSRTLKVPPLTPPHLAAMATNKPAASQPDFARMYREGLTRLPKADGAKLFASGLPRLETIHQGKLGNCFCLAPLGAMVHRDPRQVAALFALQADGRYRLTLGKHTTIVVAPTHTELAMSASSEQDGIWINLYEKAVGQLRNEERPAGQRAGTAIDALARGGSAGTMLAYITGNEMTRFSFKFAKDAAVTPAEREARLVELRQQLTDAAKEKRLMTCGTLKATTPGINSNHAYAVLDFDPKTDSVRLWNPHGGRFTPKGESGLKNGYPQQDGIFEIPVPHFVQQFSGMAFEVSVAAQKVMNSGRGET